MERRINPKMSTENEDRLSELPDPILLDILSFLVIKEAFQTSILSTRWKNLPNNLPILRLTFNKSVSQTLSLEFIDLPDDFVEPDILRRMVKYAVPVNCHIEQYPRCLFSSQTLSSLQLSTNYSMNILFPSSLNLPALTNLDLSKFYFVAGDNGYAEPFSEFKKLNTLTLRYCRVRDAPILCISSTTLVNLNVYACYLDYYNQPALRLSVSNLCNFSFIGIPTKKLCVIHPCSVKHLYIDAQDVFRYIPEEIEEDSVVVLSWLQEQGLANIKSLTVSVDTLGFLSFVPGLFKVKLTSMYNLESLKIEMKPGTFRLDSTLSPDKFKRVGGAEFHLKQAPFIPDGVVSFLLQNSPSATVSIIPLNG